MFSEARTIVGYSQRNQRKIATVKFVRDHPGCTSDDLAKGLDISLESAGMALLRAYKQGLVRRDRSGADFATIHIPHYGEGGSAVRTPPGDRQSFSSQSQCTQYSLDYRWVVGDTNNLTRNDRKLKDENRKN